MANSNYYNVLTGVQNWIQQIGLGINVVLRDDLFLLEQDVVPIIIVAPGNVSENKRFRTFSKNVVYNYEVLVAYVIAGNRSLNSDLQSYMNNRETIRNQLYQWNVPGLTFSWDTMQDIEPVSNYSSVLESNYRCCGWKMSYSVNEILQGSI